VGRGDLAYCLEGEVYRWTKRWLDRLRSHGTLAVPWSEAEAFINDELRLLKVLEASCATVEFTGEERRSAR